MPYSHILLIDDDEDDQEIFLSAVSEVSEASICIAESSARRALQRLENNELTPDVIFLDFNMPIMNGHQFLVEIKKNDALRRIPVFMLSTSSNPLNIKGATAMGAEKFITKPNNFKELKNILQTILQ